MARPGVINRTSAVLASSQAVAAGSIAFNSGSLQGSEKSICVRFGGVTESSQACGAWSAGLDEVLIRPRWCGAALALVFGAGLRTAIGVLGGARQPQQAQLADLHSRPQRYRQVRDIRQLEGDVAGKAGVDEARRRVGQQA